MRRLLALLPVALPLALAPAGCGAPEEPLDAEPPEVAEAIGPIAFSCGGASVCSGSSDVVQAAWRIGTSATARTELLQPFVSPADASATAITFSLRLLRPLPAGASPLVHVELHDLTTAAAPDTLVGSVPVATGTRALALGSGLMTIPLTMAAPSLVANRTYGLLIRSDAVVGATVLAGVGMFGATTTPVAKRRAARRSGTDPFPAPAFIPLATEAMAFGLQLLSASPATITTKAPASSYSTSFTDTAEGWLATSYDQSAVTWFWDAGAAKTTGKWYFEARRVNSTVLVGISPNPVSEGFSGPRIYWPTSDMNWMRVLANLDGGTLTVTNCAGSSTLLSGPTTAGTAYFATLGAHYPNPFDREGKILGNFGGHPWNCGGPPAGYTRWTMN